MKYIIQIVIASVCPSTICPSVDDYTNSWYFTNYIDIQINCNQVIEAYLNEAAT